MAEYIDKQAFNDAIRGAVRKYPNTFYNGLEVARQIAHDMDAADVAPVVRCKDCKHRGEQADCPFCWLADMKMGDEHFCSYGERRADA